MMRSVAGETGLSSVCSEEFQRDQHAESLFVGLPSSLLSDISDLSVYPNEGGTPPFRPLGPLHQYQTDIDWI